MDLYVSGFEKIDSRKLIKILNQTNIAILFFGLLEISDDGQLFVHEEAIVNLNNFTHLRAENALPMIWIQVFEPLIAYIKEETEVFLQFLKDLLNAGREILPASCHNNWTQLIENAKQ